jgi:predicted alpha/beta hydrolase family esterase
MSAQPCAHVLLLPGWQNSGPDHWQSRWETRHGFVRVQQADWDWPRRGDWMAQLEEAVLAHTARTEANDQAPQPLLLAAHSLGCQLVASWAAHSRHAAAVAGALLVAPPDTERQDMPPQLHTWRPIARTRLPFPSQVVYSLDDPFCHPKQALAMAAAWGAAPTALGQAGHINAQSRLGDWDEGLAMLTQLQAQTGTHRTAG